MITLKSGVSNYIYLKGEPYSYFAGNDYLGLANHPDIIKNSIHALEKYGINFAASRQTTGSSDIHEELENLLADFKAREDAVVFASGYIGNRLLLHALKEEYSIVLADSSSHPSIIDGISAGIANVNFYEHCNPEHLENLLKKHKKRRPLIITDGIFALTGEIAPIDKVYSLAERYNALLIVDDAHATGMLGKNGRGTPEHFNINHSTNLYQSETMSKALGGYGGFIAADKKIIQDIRNKSTFFGASTALPPPIVAAGCSSIRLIKQQPNLRKKLIENTSFLRTGIKEMDFDTIDGITPIVPVFFKNQEKAKNLSNYLETNRIIAPSVNYPVKIDKFIVRITVSAVHTKDQIENLLYVLKKWREKEF